MSTTALTKLLDLLTSTLSTSDMAWLIEGLSNIPRVAALW